MKISYNSGNDITADPVFKTSYSYTNRELDVESGMIYCRARYYMPEIGRFIQEDPHPGRLKSPSTYNSNYIYTLNNPLKYRDPSGEFITLAAIGYAALTGALVGGGVSLLKGDGFGDVISSTIGGAVGGALGAVAVAAGGAFLGPYVGKLAGQLIGGGLLGAISSTASGGSFSSGFVNGALSVLAFYTLGEIFFGSSGTADAPTSFEEPGGFDLDDVDGLDFYDIPNTLDLINPDAGKPQIKPPPIFFNQPA